MSKKDDASSDLRATSTWSGERRGWRLWPVFAPAFTANPPIAFRVLGKKLHHLVRREDRPSTRTVESEPVLLPSKPTNSFGPSALSSTLPSKLASMASTGTSRSGHALRKRSRTLWRNAATSISSTCRASHRLSRA